MRKLVITICLLVISLNAQEIYATFNIEAEKKANLAFSSSGIIENINVDIGTTVKQNEILAVLNSDDLKANLNISNTTLKYAKRDLDRQKKVKNIIDKAKYDVYALKYESSLAQVKYQQSLLEKTNLKAPFDGVIIAKELEVGDVVSGQMIKTVFKIQSQNKRKLILEFDQKYHNIIKEGDIYNYKIDGDEKSYSGTIYKIYPYANIKTRKIKAEIALENVVVGLSGDGYITTTK